MAYQALYRKYRPKTFENVYGQNVIVRTLKNVIKNDKLNHAYLFTGPRGTGKTSSAKLFAKAINCLNNISGDACNECSSCNSFNENTNPDIIEIDAASNNGVDEIREIRNKVNLVPSISKYKVYIIDEVHMLSIGAFNALLKTLEEPPKHIVFILATTEPQKLPVTVISRCQRFDFKNINPTDIKKCLQNIITKEKIKIEEDALNEIVNNAMGGMRDAIGLIDQANAFSDGIITLEDIQLLSGSLSDDNVLEIIKSIENKDISKVLSLVSTYILSGKDIILMIEKILEVLRKDLISKKINNNYKSKIDFKIDDLYKIIDFLADLLINLKATSKQQILLEVGLIKIVDLIAEKPQNSFKGKELPEKFSKEEITVESNEIIDQLKDVRINNILKDASKTELIQMHEYWKKIKEYLLNNSYKMIANILINGKPVAASSAGVVITFESKVLLDQTEKNYDKAKKLIQKICNKKSKIVFILNDYWLTERPKYAQKVKDGNIIELNETKILKKYKETLKSSEPINDFNDLIEMENE
ncbi:MAG: DNA polymerase III subunit gamma/tau [Bacilli bacterium]